MAERIDLDDSAEFEFLDFAQMNHAVEDRFPILVAGEIVVGDEEAVEPLCDIGADDLLDVLGRTPSRLAALHIDDGAERALIRAAAPASKLVTEPAVRLTRSASSKGIGAPSIEGRSFMKL